MELLTTLLIFSLITVSLSIYSYFFLAIPMLVKIIPKRKELLKKSIYIPMFDFTKPSDPPSPKLLLDYLGLVTYIFLVIVIVSVTIIFSFILGVSFYVILLFILYSIITSVIIFKSKISDLEKFYIDPPAPYSYDTISDPYIFIRSKNKLIENLFYYSRKFMWSIIAITAVVWIIIYIRSLFIN